MALCNPGDRGMVICHPLVRFCARDRDREKEGRDMEQGIPSGETYEFSVEKYCKSSESSESVKLVLSFPVTVLCKVEQFLEQPVDWRVAKRAV